MVTPYRVNAYQEPEGWKPDFWDRVSFKLVGHYCLFTNLATALTIAVPLWLAVFGFGYAIFKIATICWMR